uniref:Major facilitator-type transporter psiT2 n=1 Tax=Psilocybe cyanescens TaxID=93625 RepID=PSIT2_PSICY|nr:RecName: Full=Major facilitator-type transporter psiT2; AltName: Full=Psilocybin biosynthesis cluster transporter 2 [Psilocybe cyanescens]ASU62249.1 putative transporter [Psilocybe cyanescens]
MSPERSASLEPDEHSSLLSDTASYISRDDLEDSKAKQIPTPIPKKQLGVLFSIRFTEPIIYSHLWPYINQFVNDIGVADGNPRYVGFYSGLIESVFACGEVCSIFMLSRLSDRIGRRPVLLPSALGVALFTALFGLSTSFTMMLVLRVCAGLLAGATPIVHSVVSELTDETNNALVVPLYGLITPIGFAIGPLIGGTLEHAATKYPNVFGYDFLRKYPYFLPSFVPCCLAVVGVTFGYFFLQETLPSIVRAKKRLERQKSTSSISSRTSTLYGATDDHNRDASESTALSPEEAEDEIDSKPQSIKALIVDPSMRAIMGSGTFLMFLYTSSDVLFSLYCFTAVEDGGVGLPPDEIGYAFSVAGVIAMLMQLCITPWVLRTFDKAKVYKFCMFSFPLVFALMGCLNPLAQTGYNEVSKTIHPTTTGLLYAAIAVLLLLARVCVMAFPISMMLIKQNADKNSLATANGLVQVSMTIARALCPTVSSSLFAYSTSNNILGGHLWVLIMVTISLAGVWQSMSIARVTKRKEEL